MRHFLISLFFVSVAGVAAADCPDPALGGARFAATGPDLIVPQRWELPARGDAIAPCPDWAAGGVVSTELQGYLPIAPTAVFELDGMGPHILMVMAEAECDPLLAVRAANGLWHFGETANGRQEVVVWSAPDGPLQVWLGSGDATGCTGSVILETFDR